MGPGQRTRYVEIRPATEADLPLLLAFIKELAEYERLADEVVATEDHLRHSLFGPHPAAEAILAYFQGQPAGYGVFFHNFSTFLGRHGLYLEDLYVRPQYRGKGLGRAMLAHLATLARERNCGRLELMVLDWNEPAIDFYKSLGSVPMDGWTTHSFSGSALDRLGNGWDRAG